MKFLHLTFRFEFTEAVEGILERNGVARFVRYPMVQGRDRDGRHYGSKVFPGSITVVQAHVPDDIVAPLTEELKSFREEREAHHHLEALFLHAEEAF